jgi:deoxyribodipyrimidine photolyase-like uncharacterized protein
MTMPIQFDTLEFAKTLQAAGIPQDQAEAHAQALGTALSGAVVVPSELVLVKADLLARMELLKHELEARMELLKHELEARMDSLQQAFEARMDSMQQTFNARMDTLENSFGKLRRLVLTLTLTSLACNAATLVALAMLLSRH